MRSAYGCPLLLMDLTQVNKNKLAPYQTGGRLLLTANFKVT